MEDVIKNWKHFNLQEHMCHLLNLTERVKQAPKTFETDYFRAHSIAYSTFSNTEADNRIGTLY